MPREGKLRTLPARYRKEGERFPTSPRTGLNKPFIPSRSGVVSQVELPRWFIGWVSANVQKVKRPSLLRRSFLAPVFEITLLGVVIPMASAMAGGSMCAALALVDGVMAFYLLASADRLSAEVTIHISIPPTLIALTQRVCGQFVCSQAFLMRTSENCFEPFQACCSSSCCSSLMENS